MDAHIHCALLVIAAILELEMALLSDSVMIGRCDLFRPSGSTYCRRIILTRSSSFPTPFALTPYLSLSSAVTSYILFTTIPASLSKRFHYFLKTPFPSPYKIP